MSPKPTLSPYDYILFSFTFIASMVVGIYFGCFGKKFTTNDYLIGNRQMKFFPTTLSLIASYFSGIGFLALPADVYRYGTTYIWSLLNVVLTTLATIYIFLPVFYKLKTVSIYDYLEKRFDKRTKSLGSFLFVLYVVLFLPLVVYLTSLTIAACTGLNVNLIVWVTCGICTFYTAIGGFKAVVWTDTLQCFFMIVGTIAVIVLGFYSVGSFQTVWSKSSESGRLDILNFSFDPTERDTFWAIIIGDTVGLISYTSVNQAILQRLVALPTIKKSTMSAICFGIGIILNKTAFILTGLLIYSYYYGCDPVQSKKLSKHDQILPYFVMDTAENIPGLTGIFLACVCSSSLSTLSTYLNCAAGCLYEDFLSKLFKEKSLEKYDNYILKTLVVCFGILSASLTFVVDRFENMFPLLLSIYSLTFGPKLSLFTLGMLFPKVNAKGAFYGSILGIIFTACIIIPTKYYQIQGSFKYTPKPLSVENCVLDYQNITLYSQLQDYVGLTLNNTVKSGNITSDSGIPFIFRISFYYSAFIGTAFCMVSSLFISYVTYENGSSIDKSLVSPVSYFLLPDNIRQAEDEDEDEGEDEDDYQDVDTALKTLKENSGKC